jgi:hypothetical protein
LNLNPAVCGTGASTADAELQDRLPPGTNARGTMTFSVNGGRPISVPLKPQSVVVSKKLHAHVHRGMNKVTVSFGPTGYSSTR